MGLTYSSYLKIDELLRLQQLRSEPPEHDEMLFIVIHQVYELWFREIIHELDYMCESLVDIDISRASKTLKRVNTILKVAVHQVDILETMTPLEFLSFRDYLDNASGFQSWQFRELEFMLGAKRRGIMKNFEGDPKVMSKMERRFGEPTIWDVFIRFLADISYNVPAGLLERDVTKPYEPSDEIQDILLEVYKTRPDISRFCELLVDFDEGLQEWRYRHVKMVQRTIGSKMGTGGSEGVEYLKTTLFRPAFPDLWQIRTRFSND